MSFFPLDGCRRTPRPVRRLLRRHPGETGIVLHRWSITRCNLWTNDRREETVTVSSARPGRSRTAELKAWFDDARLGRESAEPVARRETQRGDLRPGPPTWIGLDPGEHTIDFHGFAEPLRSQTVRLGPGDRFLIAFRPPVRLPLRPLPARWCLRALPDGPN